MCSGLHFRLARGIDTYAHPAALRSEGRTIAVLGSGLDRRYPEENRGLAAEIVGRGAIVTEPPLGTPPGVGSFVHRRQAASSWE